MTGYPDDNPKTAFGIKKPPLAPIPPSALLYLGQAMQDGRIKYNLMNWREKKVSATVFYDAALRHLFSWYDGEDCDAYSGVHHLAHYMACGAILLDAMETGMLNDDRPKKGVAAALIERLAQDGITARQADSPVQETHCSQLEVAPRANGKDPDSTGAPVGAHFSFVAAGQAERPQAESDGDASDRSVLANEIGDEVVYDSSVAEFERRCALASFADIVEKADKAKREFVHLLDQAPMTARTELATEFRKKLEEVNFQMEDLVGTVKQKPKSPVVNA